MTYVMVPVFEPSDPRSRLTSGSDGTPGVYRITVVLAVPGKNVVREDVDFESPDTGGDSLLVAPAGAQEFQIRLGNDNEHVVTTIHLNDHRRLRAISLDVEASDFQDAVRSGHDLVMPMLSRWSFLHNVAITTSGFRIQELTTGATRIDLTIIGATKTFSDRDSVSTPGHRVLLAAYREGISSAEPLWQALSLYKVAEGVWTLRRRRQEAAVAAGQPIHEPSEHVPQDVSTVGHPNERDRLAESLAPYAGRKFRTAFDDIRVALRNSIAHLELDGDPLAQDSWDDVRRIYDILPALRWMSRYLLEVEIGSTDET
jgi:hypothetical protein